MAGVRDYLADLKARGRVLHEGQGRLAGVREFRQLQWPTPPALQSALPRPCLPPDHQHLLRIWDEAWPMLVQLQRTANPLSGLPNDYFGTALHGFADFIFFWDSCFTTMAAA